MKIHNFYAGPSILPATVLEKAQKSLVDFENTGLSILEISHRSKEFMEVMENARKLVLILMNLTDDYAVLFLQGGASSQFFMVPQNLLNPTDTAGYIDTGNWANLALEEAKSFGNVQVVASSANENYNHIPTQFIFGNSLLKYTHITTNNTIFGTQWNTEKLNLLKSKTSSLVADMSSDIFSREIDYSQFDLIYAGAQKNMGTSGCTLVVIKKSVLTSEKKQLPKMLDYQLQIAHDSMRNTPAVFSVYIAYLTLLWIQENTLQKIYLQNIEKAKLLYAAIDNSSIFKGTVNVEDRSAMNVCFVMKDKNLEKPFSDFIKSKGIVGLEGYRTVGGFRASIYNAMPLSSVAFLVELMSEFEKNL